MMKAAKTDIDIDVRDRSEILNLVKHIPASREEKIFHPRTSFVPVISDQYQQASLVYHF